MKSLSKPSRLLTFIVILIISSTFVAEYYDVTHIPTTFPSRNDNFPQPLSSLDTKLFIWVNVDLANRIVAQILSVITLLGSLYVSVIVCGLLFLSKQKRRGITLSLSIITVSILTVVLKTAIALLKTLHDCT